MQPSRGRRNPLASRWWLFIPLVTFGFGTFVMVGIAGLKLRSQSTVAAAAVYLGLTVAALSVPEGGAFDLITALYFLLVWVFGTVHVALLQPRVRQRAGQGEDPAVAAALWRTQRRQEARQLLAENPALAAELGIGRTDFPSRQYIDGGLVDLNHVPAPWLAYSLELTPAQAADIVRAREHLGGLTSAEELIIHCEDFTIEHLAAIKDRLVFIPM
jgi:hypothetical protein